MRRLPVRRDGLIASRMVIALIQTQGLGLPLRRLRPLHHDGLEGGRQERGVLDIRPGPHYAQRASRRFDHQAAFHPFLPRSVGLRPTTSPPRRALPMAVSAACHGHSTPCHAAQASTSPAQRCATPPW